MLTTSPLTSDPGTPCRGGPEEALAASRRAEQRQVLLVRELHHRVRNTLAMVQGLLGATARTTGTIRDFYRSLSARIGSLAKTQTLLTEDYGQTAPLRELLLKELRPFEEHDKRRFVLDGAPVELSADLAVPIGMALHELTTNAVRHGALSVPAGWVEVTWELKTVEGIRKVRIDWGERGGQPVRTPEHEGFGSTLLRSVVPMQTKAEVESTKALVRRCSAAWSRCRLRPRLRRPLNLKGCGAGSRHRPWRGVSCQSIRPAPPSS